MIAAIMTNAQIEMHDAKITGIIEIGNKDVSVVKDLITECVYKSSPHDKGDYFINEDVQLEFENGEENPDIIKPGCNNKKCFNQGCSDVFNPDLNSEIDYKSIQVRDKGFVGVNGSDEILVFQNETDLLNTVEELYRLVDKHGEIFSNRFGNISEDKMIEKAQLIGYDQDHQIHIFNNRLGFNSLFKQVAEEENSFLQDGNESLDSYPDHFFPGSAERSTLNADVEVQIGNAIYKYNEDGTYLVITDADLNTLKGIDDGTLDVEQAPNVAVYDPNTEPLNGPSCKTNKSTGLKTTTRSDGKYKIEWKLAIYNYPPYYVKIAYSKTKSFKWKWSWGKYRWVKSYPSSIRAGAQSYSSCSGTGSGNKYKSNKHYVIYKQSAGWKSLSGQIIGIHQAHNITKHSTLYF